MAEMTQIDANLATVKKAREDREQKQRLNKPRGGFGDEATITHGGKTTSTPGIKIVSDKPKEQVQQAAAGLLALAPSEFGSVDAGETLMDNLPETEAEFGDKLEQAEKDSEAKKKEKEKRGKLIFSNAVGELYQKWTAAKNPQEMGQQLIEVFGPLVANEMKSQDIAKKERDKAKAHSKDELDSMLTQQQQDLDKFNQKVKRAEDKITKITMDVQESINRGIDPQQYFHDRSAFSTIIGAIAIGMGAYASAVTGSPNYALEIINDAIERDIEAQTKNLELQKEGAEMQIDALKSGMDWEINRFDRNQNARATRWAAIGTWMNNLLDTQQMDEKGRNRIQNLLIAGNESVSKHQLATENKLDALKQAKAYQDLINAQLTSQQKRQEIAQTRRETTVGPAAFRGIPFLENVPSAYLSGSTKTDIIDSAVKAKDNFARSAAWAKSIEQFKALEKHTKYIDKGTGAARAIFGRHRKDWARLHNEMKRQASLMTQPVKELLFKKDPRMSDLDQKMIEAVKNSKSIESFHSMIMRAGMHKLDIMKDTAKVIAVDGMSQFYRQMASTIEIPEKIRQQINNLLKNDDFKTSLQKTEELYDFFKKAGL